MLALKHVAIESFDFERTWWRLFRKRILRTKVYMFYYILY
jgi:hypothetical protein